MDSLTQIILGASVAEAVAGKKMGNKAAFFGAIAGTIPDLDVFLRSFYHPIETVLIHRGFSHSILFAIIVSPMLAWLLFKLYKNKYTYKTWLILFFLGIVTHPILDAFTNYGTQLFWPFNTRVSFNTIFVLDPLYTIPFGLCLLVCLFISKQKPLRHKINKIGLIYSSLYLLWGVCIKLFILSDAKSLMRPGYENKIKTVVVKPMPLTTFYWSILTEEEDQYRIGYKSLFYEFEEKDIESIPKENTISISDLKWKGENYNKTLTLFCGNFGFAEKRKNGLTFYNLRFGTASMLTQKKYKRPVFGFEFETNSKNEIINTNPLKPGKSFKEINTSFYFNKIFLNSSSL